MSLAIETEKLTKAYGRKAPGIEDVDLAVEEGEVFGFLGPNGVGKTTTVRTLLGLLRPTGGRGEVFGLDIRKDSVEVRARVGNLPGEFALEDKMTGEQAEDRARSGHVPQASAPDTGRAYGRARPARAGGIPRHHRGGEGRGTYCVLL